MADFLKDIGVTHGITCWLENTVTGEKIELGKTDGMAIRVMNSVESPLVVKMKEFLMSTNWCDIRFITDSVKEKAEVEDDNESLVAMKAVASSMLASIQSVSPHHWVAAGCVQEIVNQLSKISEVDNI